jgi:hypothetical protein
MFTYRRPINYLIFYKNSKSKVASVSKMIGGTMGPGSGSKIDSTLIEKEKRQLEKIKLRQVS